MASLAKAGALSSVNVMFGAAAAFAATLLVSHSIGDAGAGRFFQIMALFAIGTSMAVFGADTALVRTVSAAKARGRAASIPGLIKIALPPVLGLSLALALLLVIASSPTFMPELSASERLVYRVSAPFLVLSAAMTALFGVLRGLGLVARYTFAQNVLLPTLRIGALALVLAVTGSALYLALAWALPLLLVFALTLWWVRRAVRKATLQTAHKKEAGDGLNTAPLALGRHGVSGKNPDEVPEETARSFWGFASARGFAAMVEQVLEWIDVLLVAAFLGPAAGGVYGAVNRSVRIGVMVDHVARIVTGPSISAAFATENKGQARDLFTATTRILVLAAWPFYLTLAFFGGTILSFFGEGFEVAAPVLWIICPAMMLAMSAGGVQSLLLMSGKSRWQLYNKCAALVAALVLNLLLIPRLGLVGAGIAWAAAVLVDTALATWQVAFYTGIKARLTEMLPAVALALLVPGGGALLLTRIMGDNFTALAVHSLAILPLYVCLLFFFRQPIGIAIFMKRRRSSQPEATSQLPAPLATQRKVSSSMTTSPRRRASSRSMAGTVSSVPSQVSLMSQARRVFRQPLALLTCGLLGSGLLGGYALTQPTEYEAEARVLVYPLATDPTVASSSNLRVDISTESLVADSREVASKASTILNLTDPAAIETLMKSTKVSGHSQTAILDIEATGASPEEAAARANALAQAYLDVRSETYRADLQEAIKNIETQIQGLAKNNNNNATVATLREELGRISISTDKAGRIVSQASAVSSPKGFSLVHYLLIGLAGGLIIGIPVAYLVDRRKAKLGYPDRAEEIIGSEVNLVSPASAAQDLQLALRQAGIANIAEISDDYRGLVLYAPSRSTATNATALLEQLAPEGAVHYVTSPALSTDGVPVVTSLSTYAELPQALDLAEELGYGILALSPETPYKELARINKELASSEALFVPVFLLK